MDVVMTSNPFHNATILAYLEPSTNMREGGTNEGCKWSVLDVGIEANIRTYMTQERYSRLFLLHLLHWQTVPV